MKTNKPQLMSATEYVASRGRGVVDFTENGECSKCGGCCSNRLPLMRSEIERIRKFVRKRKIQPINHLPPGSILMARPPVDMMCPFHHPEKGCLIYEIRPWVCRQFICNRPDWNIAKAIKDEFESGKEEFKYMDVCGVRYEIWGIIEEGEAAIPF